LKKLVNKRPFLEVVYMSVQLTNRESKQDLHPGRQVAADQREFLGDARDCFANESNPKKQANNGIPRNANGRIFPHGLIALVLFGTAALKLWMLLTDAFADIRVGIPREILWLSVALEFWLAYENLVIRDRRVLAFMNTIVFGAFATFASIRWLLGYGTCGCSGNIEIPAWVFIILDLAIVAWFTRGTIPRQELLAGLRELIGWWRGWSPERRGQLVGVGLFATVIVAVQLPVAAPLRAMALGEPAIQATVRIDGDLILNQETAGKVELWNRSSHSGKIIGQNRSCRCFVINGDPIFKSIPAGGRISFPLVIKPEKPDPLHQRVVLFLDHPEQFRVNIDVVGFVKGEK
jgi:hypothetical protein